MGVDTNVIATYVSLGIALPRCMNTGNLAGWKGAKTAPCAVSSGMLIEFFSDFIYFTGIF